MVSKKRKPDIGSIVNSHFPSLDPYISLYKDIHQNPELGTQERRTSSIVSARLEALGFKVHRNIGGHGVVGVLSNGDGPSILLRADMDALPVREETGLPYASHKDARDRDGETTPVMHACGHDMHIACLLAAASLLYDACSTWSGTLICLFQPDEEGGTGAKGMVDDELYKRIPKPDIILGQHVDHRRTGNVAICAGTFMAAADSFDVAILGRGGHGAQPQNNIDPIVIAAYTIVRLQSIVSRVVSPTDPVVVTCGSIHGGAAGNVVPDRVDMKLSIRTYDLNVRDRVLKTMKQIVKSECDASGVLERPIIKTTQRFPPTENNPDLVHHLQGAFRDFFDEGKVEKMERLAGSEDFSNLARPDNIPYAYWFFGGTDAAKWDEAEKKGQIDQLPHTHSAKFAPVIDSTLRTGIQAFALGALRFLVNAEA